MIDQITNKNKYNWFSIMCGSIILLKSKLYYDENYNFT